VVIMGELDFCGFASQPGNCLSECLDAAGIDASLASHGQHVDVSDASTPGAVATGHA
jgi:hypothetical protein